MKQDKLLDDLFEIVDEQEVYEFAKAYAYKNSAFAEQLKRKFQKKLPSEDKIPSKEELLKSIDRCFCHEQEYPSDGWHNGWEPEFQDWFAVGRDIQRVQRQMQMLVESGHEETALEMALNLLEKGGKEYDQEFEYGNEELDYEDLHAEETINIIGVCFSSGKIPDKQQLEVCNRLHQLTKMEAYDSSDFEAIIDETRERLLTDDERIDLRRQEFQNAVGDYARESAAKELWDYLLRHGRDDEAVVLYKKNSLILGLRTKYVDWLIGKRKLDDAIQTLDKGISESRQWLGVQIDWQEKKLNIYEMMGDAAHVLSQTEWLMLNGRNTMSYYGKLKKLTDKAEWPQKLRALLAKKSSISTSTLAQIYEKEKWTDDLYQLMMKEQYGLLSYISRYAKLLSSEQQKDVVGKMTLLLRKQAANQMGRDRYRELTNDLKTLRKSCKVGERLSQELVSEFKEKYRNRPAMLDELSKF